MVHSGRDHSHACRGGCGQKTHSSDENVEEIVETNWQYLKDRCKKEPLKKSPMVQRLSFKREIVKVIQLISQERISERIIEPIDVNRTQRSTMYLHVAEKWTRQRFEQRWKDSWNAYEIVPGARALEKSWATQARCATMIASDSTDTYMEPCREILVETPNVKSSDGGVKAARPLQRRGPHNDARRRSVVRGTRKVGHVDGMSSVKGVDMENGPTKARDFGQGGSQESRASTVDRLEALVVRTLETKVGRAHEYSEEQWLDQPEPRRVTQMWQP